jgi:hypothetical protein
LSVEGFTLAKLCRFYSLTPNEVQSLNARTAQELWLAITKLEATEMRNQIIVSSYPNLKPEDRKKLIRSIEQQMKVEDNKPKSEFSNEDLAKWLRGALG